ncbi:MAG: VWA domain-containing protein [Chitinophagales bacterium]|nr:VWA domain-containing protein [Chitinophagales bacterium]
MKRLAYYFSFLTVALLCSSAQAETTENTTSPEEKVIDNKLYKGKNFATTKNGAITLKAGLSNDFFTPNIRNGYLYVEVQADEFKNEKVERLPLNISLVIDRSGSMSGDKIKYVKEAAKFVVNNMSKDDILSIIIYDDQVEVLQEAIKVENKQLIINKINQITDRGSTNLTGGMLQGYTQVKANYKTGYVNRVLILSDGLANQGITDPTEIQKIVQKKNTEDGISISTFGVGNDYNEDLMTAMAEFGAGNYYFIDSPDKIPSIFEKELKGLMSVVAQNANLKIELPTNVELVKVYGYKYNFSNNTIDINFRDVFSEEQKGVLIKYRVKNEAGKSLEFKTALNYDDASSYKNENINLSITQQFTDDVKIYEQAYIEKIQEQIILFEANEKLELAIQEADNGNYNQAKKYIEENNLYLKQNGFLLQKSSELQKLQKVNEDYGTNLDDAENMSIDEVKFMQKSNKSMSYDIKKKK